MLICPQCEFENPNNHKYCQKCGISLTDKSCHQCGLQVSLSALQCHNCGAYTGQVWKAIIYYQTEITTPSIPEINVKKLSQEEFIAGGNPLAKDSAESAADIITEESEEILESSQNLEEKIEIEDTPEPDNLTKSVLNIEVEETQPKAIECSDDLELATVDILSPMSEAVNTENPLSLNDTEILSTASEEKYLDPQQRYQVLETIPASNQGQTVVVQVLDRYPLEETPIQAWLKNNCDQQITPERMEALIIPIIAQPYIALQTQIPKHLPTIHDSWRSYSEESSRFLRNAAQTPEEEILLLADYSSWPRLVDLWGNPELPQLQILSWLQQMTELWIALTPWDCCQSILEDENLLVNQADNNSIKLQRLYSKPGEAKTLGNLMLFWQWLFEKSQRTQFGWITALFQDWQNGEIQTIEQLRSYLMNTQDNLQPQAPAKSAPTLLQTDDSASEIVDNIETQDTELLPIQLVSLESSGKSDVGSQREHNEDTFGIQTQIESQETSTERIIQAKGIYVLCDGMGGHASGEIASQLGVDTIKQYFKAESSWSIGLPSEETIREAILQANEVIYNINQQEVRSGSSRMGTTLVMAMIYDTKVAVAHVGDSRLYRFSHKGGLEQITLDHEVGQREINRGVEPEIAYGRPDAYQLTQALGPRDENFVRPDIQFFNLNEDSLLILASDGLTDNQLLENNWQTHLEPLLDKQANLELGVSKLIDLANQYNGHDNITAIVIRALVKPQERMDNG
ncbi:MAG: serine/threonine phosphatase [Okeania sp. SIO2F4]|uniref:serine/threonine phosphatase n=1 Tax=Okeania sp. SIO2F4 TaxID=2607790 RepID=UPI00142B8CE4|nr:serine/threonine phosphatase [Okeania sp. SIO2F4]NES04052.1 serine/threonine phosphatase [Okeania sp. SIO2F4]